ncbi:hypothetical protein Pan258_02180 [Symmachiella dynata]|uniref:ribbon-helix-helix protein, CopG family n=1 Tax=Symmachiella dynata TaxID=2527995 RepID=UPI00118D056B|nr:ribbon-helix-helix protein, CopG family [Symmachiella dynata]QDT46201.1 hypothetical protein Pan258_02180 [Symmachiella dynata]
MAKAATKNQKKSVRTTTSIPVEDYTELERIAEKKKVSVAWVVRDAVDRYLSEEAPLFRRRRE